MRNVQRDINATMREILIDWLNEVTQEYKLTNYSLYLSVNFTDRFLTKISVHRTKLQLVGITCLLIASYDTLCNCVLIFFVGNIMN